MNRIVLVPLFALITLALHAQTLRLGVIGTDSSHAVEFTRILNDGSANDHVAGANVVAAWRGGNPNKALSRDRIAKFSQQLQEAWSIPFVPRIGDLCSKVDGLLLLSVDANLRSKELQEAAACGKPIFIDKPFAATYLDAKVLARYLDARHIAWFSASSLRFGHEQYRGNVVAVDVWGPGELGSDNALDLSWYGIHSIEALYSFLGRGVTSVSRIHTKDTDLLTAVWKDGRVGTLRLIRPNAPFGAMLFSSDGTPQSVERLQAGYSPLLQQIVRFMQTGKSPVPSDETLEIFAFMTAAQKSMQQHGVPISLEK